MKIFAPYCVSALLLGALLGGCASMPTAQPLATGELRASFTAAPEGALPYHAGWLAELNDPTLTSLINEATGNNFSLSASAARVSQAFAQAGISGASRWPSLNIATSATRSQRLSTSNAEVLGNNFTLAANLGWQLDLWQRLSARENSVQRSAEASAEDFAAARLSLAANVANAWYQLIAARQQTSLAEQRVNNFSGTRDVIADRYRNGIATALELSLARENLASASTTLLQTRLSEDQARRQLEVLLGRYPSASIDAANTLPPLSASPPAGQPASLLARRPDLRAARLRLEASHENLRDAGRNFLPDINLTGSYGTGSTEFSKLLDMDYLLWSLAASITQPIFQGGRLQAQRDLAAFQSDEAFANYAQTTLAALQEVEVALATEQSLQLQTASQQLASDEASRSARLAVERYQAGLTDIITLLETQRRDFNARAALINTRLAALQNRINLHLALGGDFAPVTQNDTRP